MTFSFAGESRSRFLEWFAQGLQRTLTRHGHQYEATPDETTKLVVNFFEPAGARAYRRKGQGTFVVGVTETDTEPDDVLRAAYPLLVRALCNLLVYVVHTEDTFKTYFITLEQGYYNITQEPDNEDAYFESLFARLEPLASSQLVVNNEFVPDLPESLWQGDAVTEQLYRAGQKLDALDLLPAPFPIEEILPPREFRHVKLLYGIGGLSYGNLSGRRDTETFWMSASGVNKANLQTIGEDILLVTDYQPERNAMVLSVPPHVQPKRVSVDAIEHWMIYREHPQVGAIVHVHAWMDGIASTEVNYPCGTLQLAQSVAELVRQAPDPAQAVIGLKNHGLTITGKDLDDIFDRIEGRIVRQVPMV